MIINNNIGMQLSIPRNVITDTQWLFGEDQSRYVIISNKRKYLKEMAKDENIYIEELGTVAGDKLSIKDCLEISVKDLIDYNNKWFYNYTS